MRLDTIILPLIALLAGCAALELGVYDPALDDRKLSTHVWESQSREAQRMLADLRVEMEARRQALSAAEVARAQLQGQLREVERRYEEARQVIDLQREELARLRDEREEVLRASRGLKTQMSRLQQQLAGFTESYKAPARARPPAQEPKPELEAGVGVTARPAEEEATTDPLLNGTTFDEPTEPDGDMPRIVVVQPGDTLWKIARRYKVRYPSLRSLNGLDDNPDLIFVGQELLLPE